MFSSFFDPSSLTDKELYDKIDEVSIRLSTAMQLNMNPTVLESMKQLINACGEELTLRQARKEHEEMGNDPCVFDSESYLKSDDESKKKDESKRKSKYKPGW